MRSEVTRAALLVLLLGCLASCGLFVSFDDFDTNTSGGGGSGGQLAIGGTVDGLGGPTGTLHAGARFGERSRQSFL